jgi:tetratricopeptide (TPR) repeat protein
MSRSIARKCLLIVVALGASGVLLHRELSDALVVRGDGALYRARPDDALHYYRRALWMDPQDGVAVDRLAFVALLSGDVRSRHDAVAICTTWLAAHPADTIVRLDRAQLQRRLGHADAARSDFELAGFQSADASALTFAGFIALRRGDRAAARRDFSAALRIAPRFRVALRGLART